MPAASPRSLSYCFGRSCVSLEGESRGGGGGANGKLAMNVGRLILKASPQRSKINAKGQRKKKISRTRRWLFPNWPGLAAAEHPFCVSSARMAYQSIQPTSLPHHPNNSSRHTCIDLAIQIDYTNPTPFCQSFRFNSFFRLCFETGLIDCKQHTQLRPIFLFLFFFFKSYT